jgi:hypothetical protein
MNAQLVEQINALRFPAQLPATLLEVEQHFAAPRLDDVPAAVRAALAGSKPLQRIQPGMRVAVGAGSRGVANLPVIVRTVVEEIRALGALPLSSRRWAATAAPPPKARWRCSPAWA